ncbi:MAG TPA: Bcr/CflA family multidrug efflux MFS transporter [Burkholderiales bacterium]|nr:Bcr/CflA family multidrug efflux MFS transporter [Burkholderiales bacterium]
MQSKNFRTTLILSALVAFAPMSIDMYLPALPALERYFATDTASVQHTLAAFFLGLTAGQLLYGPLADRYGRKPPLYFGLTLYVAASAACALAPNIGSLVALRFLQAVSGCAGMVVARAVVRDLYDHQESARVFSILLMVMGIAPIVAPLAGGFLLAWLGWRSIFWVLALFGMACLAAVKLRLPETIPAGLPRVPLSHALRNYAGLLADRRYLGYALSGGFGQAGMFAYISGSPFVIIDLYGVPAQHYGWIFGLNATGIVAFTQWNRKLLRRHDADRLLDAGNLAGVAACALLVLGAATDALGLAGILVPLFFVVSMRGLTFPNASAGAMAPFPEKAGSASALLGAVQFAIAAMASVTVGWLHDGTAVPMAAVVGTCGFLAFVSYRILVPAAAREGRS